MFDVTSPFFFYLFAGVAMATAVSVITRKNPVSSAMSLVLMFVSLAAIYALMGAHLIAAMQILVYTGAVLVLFVFVIMLLNADFPSVDLVKSAPAVKLLSVAVVLGLFAGAVSLFYKNQFGQIRGMFTPEMVEAKHGNTRVISELMFSESVLAFELTGVLLLACIVGVVIIAMRGAGTNGGHKR